MKPIAYEGKENYIFISYAHKDSDSVFPILNMLQQNNYRFWYDDGIAPGSEWPENIAQHLQASSLVIAFISPNSADSPNCRREINFALSKNKPFLSIFLEPTDMPLGMEMQLSAQQSIFKYNYSTWEGFCNKILMTPELSLCKSSSDVPEHPAGTIQPTVQNAPSETPASDRQKQKKKKLPLFLGAIGAALAVIAAVLVILLTGTKKAEPLTEASLQGTYYFVDFSDDTYYEMMRSEGLENYDLDQFKAAFLVGMQNYVPNLRNMATLNLNESNQAILALNSGVYGSESNVGTWKLENDIVYVTMEEKVYPIRIVNNQLHLVIPKNEMNQDFDMEFILEK